MKKLLIAAATILAVAGALFVYRQQAQAPEHHAKETPALSYVDAALSRMSLRDKVASLLVMNRDGTDPAALSAFMDTYRLGGFILMGENMPATDEKLLQITSALKGGDTKLPRLVAVDEEGGTVKRLLGDNYLSAHELKNLPVNKTAQAFVARSNMVASVGITLNFGVVADTTADKKSFIYDRVLGTTPASASVRVAAAVEASKGRTLTTLKHFPGHGETEADSHHTVPTAPLAYADWLVRDEPPFKAGIDAGADVVMMGHLRYSSVDSLPASLSKKWHDILRHDLGFKGAIITDAMGMLPASGDKSFADPVKTAVAALNAGNTMLLYVINPAKTPAVLIDGIVAAAERGDIRESVITDDAKAALELRSRSAGLPK
ncbi:MAG TPA: glycoside hydrolase family 3 N-terminal domain-containing protein [Verrucomicrobiae bacterium]|nr:glycoside hydrolase family 3 N-terminal domain-containing protein [Verrucomicrobiae bacterium]